MGLRVRGLAISTMVAAILMALFCSTGLALAADAEDPDAPANTTAKKTKKKVDQSKSGVHEMENMVVTATKTEVSEETVPFTTHTVTREDIETQPNHYMSNVGELIRDVPGVHVAQYYPWGPPWVHLRGTGYFIGRTIYLLDGIPINSFQSTTIHPNDIEKVDVLLGPSSALYGPNAIGGAINMITRSGKPQMGAYAETAYGSNNTVRPHTHVGDRTGPFSFYLSYSGEYSGGYMMRPVDNALALYNYGQRGYLKEATPEANAYSNTYLAGRMDWNHESGAAATLAVNYANRYLYGGQPNFVLDNFGDQWLASLKVKVPLNDWGLVRASLGYQNYYHPQLYNQGLGFYKNVLWLNNNSERRYNWRIETVPVELQTDVYPFQGNTLTGGAFFSREKETRITDNRTTGAAISHSWWTTDQKSLYIQDEQLLFNDRLSLLAGLRYDNWTYFDIYDSGSTNKRPSSVNKDTVTYRGGVKYRFNEDFAVRSSAGTAYWPGTALWFFQNVSTGSQWRVANPGLKPETSWMVDLGFDGRLRGWGTEFNITGYVGQINDMVSYTYDNNPYVLGGQIIRSSNLGGASIIGLEIGLKQELVKDRLWFLGALTLNRSRIINDPDPLKNDNQLRNSPDYFGSLGLRYLNPNVVNAEALFRFSGDRYYDDANTDLPCYHMKAYGTFDAKVWRDWKLNDKFTLTTAVSAINIMNQKYETEINYVNPGRYLEGRIGIKYTF